MTFRRAVEKTVDLNDGWRPGLDALGSDRSRVTSSSPRAIAGSVNVEACLRKRRKTDRHWDYAVGYKPSNRSDEVVYWVEVHPAYDHEIKVMKQKLTSLLKWLSESAPRLKEMEGDFVWIGSGKIGFTRGSTQIRQLARDGLTFRGRVFKIPEKFIDPSDE